MSARPLFGCIEAGGTKFVAGVARDQHEVLATVRLPTTTPAETIGALLAFFGEQETRHGRFDAFGIASFGPVDLDRRSTLWGHITKTPKPGWSRTDLAGPFGARFGCPVGFDTDVNGAVLAEGLWGGAMDVDVAVYVTVGTGIGGGAMVREQPVHGLRHPEMGHFMPRRHPSDLDYRGLCPFHGDCLEGLASGPAIIARWGASLSALPPDHVAHEVIAFYLAQLLVAQQAILSPQRIVLGGGVLGTPGLIERVRAETARLGAAYFGSPDHDELIVPPRLGDKAGLLGALALAQRSIGQEGAFPL